MGCTSKIINILLKPILEGFKIQILINKGYILDFIQYIKGDKKGPVNLNQSFTKEGFLKTQVIVLNLLLQKDAKIDKRLYLPNKYIIWLDNLFISVKLLAKL